MSRRSTSVSFDDETWELLEDQEIDNVSGFIRNVIQDYLSDEEGQLEEINRLRNEADELEEQAEEKRKRARILERGLKAESWIEKLEQKKERLKKLESKVNRLKSFRFDSRKEIEEWARSELRDKGLDPDQNSKVLEKKMKPKLQDFEEKQKLDELSTECATIREEIADLKERIPDEKLKESDSVHTVTEDNSEEEIVVIEDNKGDLSE